MIKQVIYAFVLSISGSLYSASVYAHGDQQEHPSEKPGYTKGGHSWASEMGYTHGEVVISKNGDIYVSTTVPGKGIMVFDGEGNHKHNIPNAPWDFHGFMLREEEGEEVIYGARRFGQSIVKMNKKGEWLMEVVATRIPSEFYNKDPRWNEINLTGIDVADNGDIYVVDGYGMDYIHKFSSAGKYLDTFGGRGEPYYLANCHKIFIDPRYTPERILCTDRYKKRLVHMSMEGELIGEYATDLRRPSGVAFWHDYAAIAEIAGRVSLLNKKGEVVGVLSVNDVEQEINTHKTPPEKWKSGVVTSPHGINFDKDGNLYVTEWNQFGRVLKFSAASVKKALK